jgi:hypothetical protein
MHRTYKYVQYTRRRTNGKPNTSHAFFLFLLRRPSSYAAISFSTFYHRARRLGNGAAFYGKRKSNFYGEQDKNKKSSRDVFDATEDYQGPSTSGYFGWMVDEEGQWRPVSRMKKQTLDKKK